MIQKLSIRSGSIRMQGTGRLNPERRMISEKERCGLKIWFTITGMNHYHGDDFVKKGMKVRLEKEPDNRYDREAIKVLMDGVGHIGYVANSPWTVIGESYSAGRLYDRIGDTAKGKVKLVTARGILCTLKKDKSKGDASPDEAGQELSAQNNGDK